MLSFSSCLHLSASLPLFTPFLKAITCNFMKITLQFHSLCIPLEWITITVGLFIWRFVNCIFKWYEDYKLHIWGGMESSNFDMFWGILWNFCLEELRKPTIQYVWRSYLWLRYKLRISYYACMYGITINILIIYLSCINSVEK